LLKAPDLAKNTGSEACGGGATATRPLSRTPEGMAVKTATDPYPIHQSHQKQPIKKQGVVIPLLG